MVMLLMAGGAFAFKSRRLITECRQCATVAGLLSAVNRESG